jgi:hypothetical protein
LLECFAELANVPIPEPSPLLLDARANPREMRRLLQLALEAWLRAETERAVKRRPALRPARSRKRFFGNSA